MPVDQLRRLGGHGSARRDQGGAARLAARRSVAKARVDLAFCAALQNHGVPTACARAASCVVCDDALGSDGVGRVHEQGDRPWPAEPAPCSSSSRFGVSSAGSILIPVRLPPGRARLATRPSADRVAAGVEDDRDRRGRLLRAAIGARVATGRDHVDLAGDQIGWPSAGSRSNLFLGPAVFDRHVLALDIAGFAPVPGGSGAQTVSRSCGRTASR